MTISLTKNRFLLAICFLILANCCSASEELLSLDSIDFFKTQNQQNKSLVVFWSIDCPPCFKELKTISDISSQFSDLPILLINTDGKKEYFLEGKQVINQFSLSHLKNYYFNLADATKIKNKIDPSWFGELPRSYFVDQQNNWHGHSGVINKDQILKWVK